MFKRLLVFILLLAAISFAAFFIHRYILSQQEISLPFHLSSVYIFNVISCTLICLTAELLNQKLPTQVGYAYLATVFVKMGLFVLIFQKTIFDPAGFEMSARYSMVIPTMIFLIIEAVYCGRLMNQQ